MNCNDSSRRGASSQVAAGLDPVEVAWRIGVDHAEQVEAWLSAGEVSRVSDDQARRWIDVDASVWAVVVRPWALVQSAKSKD